MSHLHLGQEQQPGDEHAYCQLRSKSNLLSGMQEAVSFVLEGLSKGIEPQQIAADMLDACLAGDPKDACGIGCDNMTCIVVLLQSQADSTS